MPASVEAGSDRRPVPLSNRRGTSAKSEDRASGVGVDRLSLSAPVRDFERDPRAWNTITDNLPGSDQGRVSHGVSVPWRNGSLYVGAQVIRATGQTVGKIEFNPSRASEEPGAGHSTRSDPKCSEQPPASGVSLATAETARRTAAEAWELAGELVEWSGPQEGARVRRIDTARDFEGVADGGALIRALAPIHRPWARRNLVHADPQRNGAQTLMVGSGAGVARLYDKHAESKGRAPEGTLRWEAECRSDWASKYGGIVRFEDLTDARVTALATERWGWSSMGVEVAGMRRVVEKVRASDLSGREQASFLGWLVLESSGQAWEAGSATLAKYRRLQRELAIAVDDLDQGETFYSRLDFETGREVHRVAS